MLLLPPLLSLQLHLASPSTDATAAPICSMQPHLIAPSFTIVLSRTAALSLLPPTALFFLHRHDASHYDLTAASITATIFLFRSIVICIHSLDNSHPSLP
ncbi:hypothetical protein B296_00028981 [Ensete ventricosum]|uniref:Secreted peptide n=1 Tax=Ensete ventricosum TaxID=4639 RepID=A0A426YEK8_ENSVE|nr:hypothetical protein B296_00028981 [Ensete ventricosum]